MTFWSAVAERSGDTALDETHPAANAGDTDRKNDGQVGAAEVGPLPCNGPARVQRAELVDDQWRPETGLRRLTLRSATRTLQRNVPAFGTSDATMFRPYRPEGKRGTRFPRGFTPGCYHLAGFQPWESHRNAPPFSDGAVEYPPSVSSLPRLVAQPAWFVFAVKIFYLDQVGLTLTR